MSCWRRRLMASRHAASIYRRHFTPPDLPSTPPPPPPPLIYFPGPATLPAVIFFPASITSPPPPPPPFGFPLMHCLPANFNFSVSPLEEGRGNSGGWRWVRVGRGGGCNPVTACPSCLSHNDVLTAGHANEWKEPSC